MAEIEFKGLSGFLATAEGPCKGGVLLLPSHFGMADQHRKQAQNLAEAGLTTVIWNQYTGRPSLVPSHEDAVSWGAELNDSVALTQMSTWLSYMFDDLGVRSAGCIGFCQGGRFALLLGANDHRLTACAPIYPTLVSPNKPNQELDAVALASEIRCPVQLVYPGADHITTRETFERLRDNLERRREPTTVHVYPGAEHGFFTRADDASNALAVQLSWPQVVAFLQGSQASAA